MPDDDRIPDAIAIITVDRLAGWMLPAYGSAWVAMPHVDALAGRGIVFDRVIATSDDMCDTLAAVAGGGSGVTDSRPWPVLAAAADRGWATAVVTDDPAIATITPSSTDTFVVPPADTTETAGSEGETNLARLFDAFVSCLSNGKHHLVWCHATSLGIAWDAPAPYRDRYLDPDDPAPPPDTRIPQIKVNAATDPDLLVSIRHVYAGQLSLLDRCIGRCVEAMAGTRRAWTTLLMGVRGLPLGLHGVVGCGPIPPYDELVHLPVVLVDHRDRMAAQRYGGLVIPDDLGATLLDLLGDQNGRPVSLRAVHSLSGLIETWHGPERDRVVSSTAAGTGIATPAWHLVVPNHSPQTIRLFAKPDDFFEVCDVADRCPAVTDELAALAAGDPARAWTGPLSPNAARGMA